MKRICGVCRTHYGDIDPLEDTRETTGYCPPCYRVALADVMTWKEAQGDNSKRSPSEDGRDADTPSGNRDVHR